MLDFMNKASGQAERPSIMSKLFPPRRMVSKHVSPPIPHRGADWCAYYEGEEEAGNYGWGATETEALRDFVENCAEDHDKRLSPPQPTTSINS